MAKKQNGTPAAKGEWNVRWVPIETLTPYADNARINDATVPALKKSIETFGFRNPLVVGKDGIVVCGHTRLKAALELGMEKLPVVDASALSQAELDAFRLVDNKIQEMSSWDYDILEEELNKLMDHGFADMGDFGFNDFLGNSDDGLPDPLAGEDGAATKGDDATAAAADPDEEQKRIIIVFDEDERAELEQQLGVKLDGEQATFSLEKLLEAQKAYAKEHGSAAADDDADAETEGGAE